MESDDVHGDDPTATEGSSEDPIRVFFGAGSSQAFAGVLRILAERGRAVSIKQSNGPVVHGVPLTVEEDRMTCVRWDADSGVPSDDHFTIMLNDVVNVRVW